ncbi:MAG: 16S rRNA (adenine(1518)-N(6)/adenine(1519)-N(6))-dimethyltransferase RsmA [Clostridiales bacterium]|nr:16S rRNA (adenine(1518)-N(6)/adenine(1519)-N(6))-dimethyltransferase RsmA [Clostridiales bacterium]
MMSDTKKIIEEYGLKLTKSLGQNFLVDSNILRKIVDLGNITKDDLVIEVGPGIGNMTREVAKRAGKVIAVEKDQRLIEPLQANLSEFGNVEVINEDFLEVDVVALAEMSNVKSIKIIGNLPYYITTPIIMSLLEEEVDIDSMVFMVQKEVAQRMTAKEGTKEYGALTVTTNFYATVNMLFAVSANCFLPKPKVDSAVVKLDVNKVPKVPVISKEFFKKTVRSAFGKRRKTLLNALATSGEFGMSKDEFREILDRLGIKENQRGETLSVNQFAELADEIYCRLIGD